MSISRTSTDFGVRVVLVVVLTAGIGLASGEGLPKRYTETITTQNGEKLSLEMVLIPGGSFEMGSPAGEAGRGDDEGPQHEVRLDPFYLCTTETTIDLFVAYYQETVSAKKDFLTVQAAKEEAEQAGGEVDAITGPTPVYGDMTMGYSEKHPAIGMTWHNAMTFCRWLSKKTGKSYRLPTEAEWEYACRAGTKSVFGFGDDPKEAGDFAWYEANTDAETCEVGKKKPNAWDLYDMLGNVREWVYDFYSADGYGEAAKKGPTVNPQGPESGKVHVARGGDYSVGIEQLRCAARSFEEEWWRSGDPQIPKSIWWLPEMDFIGFRVARTVERDGQKADKPAFRSSKEGEYEFDTGVVRGKLRAGGRSGGLSSVVHVPSGTRLDGGVGILGYYRVFTRNRRYGSAAWDWPSTSKLLPDGAVQISWPAGEERPFELAAVYRWSGRSALDVETTVRARTDLDKFEVFLASYFNERFGSPYAYVGANREQGGKPGLLAAKKSYGDWQMFPREEAMLEVIHDGRWEKEPNPVKWVIMPRMGVPICLRRGVGSAPTVVLMAPLGDCFAMAMPYEGESHYSLYLSLFGRDIKAGETARARSRFVVTGGISDREIPQLYQEYIKDLADSTVAGGGS